MNMSGTVVGDGPRWPGHHPSQETPSIAGTGTGGSQTFNSEGPSPLRSIEKETPERNPKKLRVVVRAVRLFNQRCPFLPKIKVSYAQIFARIRPSIAVSSSMLMVDTVDPHGSMAASYWDHVEAWHNIPWKVISKTGSHDIATKVDTQSQHSLISKTAAKSMGLKRLLLLHAIDLEGFAGGRERFVQYVQVELECALLGLSRVEGPMLVSTKIDGMIIGTNMNSKYELGRKILAAQDRYGLFPPGMSANSMARNNVIYPIYDDRKKGMRCPLPISLDTLLTVWQPRGRGTRPSMLRRPAKGTSPSAR